MPKSVKPITPKITQNDIRKNANWTRPGLRRKIYTFFYTPKDGKKRTVQQIADEMNLTFWQVYRIIAGKTKLDGSPRSDKGQARNSNKKPAWTLDNFQDLDEFQFFILMQTLEDLATTKLDPMDKLKISQSIETILKKQQDRTLTAKMRRPDAEVIALIIRKYEPGASYQRVVEIFKEAHETFIRNQKNPGTQNQVYTAEDK